MNQLSILETSKILSISRDTLRYYDKIGLICPRRGDNRYRYYAEEDLILLPYIEVMKYAGFSLKEIKQTLQNRQECSGEALTSTLGLLENKIKVIKKKVELYQYTLKLIIHAVEMLEEKTSNLEFEEMNHMIQMIYGDLRGDIHEE